MLKSFEMLIFFDKYRLVTDTPRPRDADASKNVAYRNLLPLYISTFTIISYTSPSTTCFTGIGIGSVVKATNWIPIFSTDTSFVSDGSFPSAKIAFSMMLYAYPCTICSTSIGISHSIIATNRINHTKTVRTA